MNKMTGQANKQLTNYQTTRTYSLTQKKKQIKEKFIEHLLRDSCPTPLRHLSVGEFTC